MAWGIGFGAAIALSEATYATAALVALAPASFLLLVTPWALPQWRNKRFSVQTAALFLVAEGVVFIAIGLAIRFMR